MGRKDVVTYDYLSECSRFAQVCNNELFGGKTVVRPEGLRELDSITAYSGENQGEASPRGQTPLKGEIPSRGGMPSREKTRSKDIPRRLKKGRDIVKRYEDDFTVLMIGIENQTGIHYAMPLRNFLYEALNYEKQRTDITRRHREAGDLTGDEFVSGFSKKDKLVPVITLVIYYGSQAWSGPQNLHEMLELSPELEAYKELINNYKINIMQIHSMENLEQYTGELKALFGFIKYQKNKEALNQFVKGNQEIFQAISLETVYAIQEMANARELDKFLKENVREEEEIDMCQALQEMIADGRQEGREEGEKRGRQEGEKRGRQEGREEGEKRGRQEGEKRASIRINELNRCLIQDNRMADVLKAAEDTAVQQKLFKEYGIR